MMIYIRTLSHVLFSHHIAYKNILFCLLNPPKSIHFYSLSQIKKISAYCSLSNFLQLLRINIHCHFYFAPTCQPEMDTPSSITPRIVSTFNMFYFQNISHSYFGTFMTYDATLLRPSLHLIHLSLSLGLFFPVTKLPFLLLIFSLVINVTWSGRQRAPISL